MERSSPSKVERRPFLKTERMPFLKTERRPFLKTERDPQRDLSSAYLPLEEDLPLSDASDAVPSGVISPWDAMGSSDPDALDKTLDNKAWLTRQALKSSASTISRFSLVDTLGLPLTLSSTHSPIRSLGGSLVDSLSSSLGRLTVTQSSDLIQPKDLSKASDGIPPPIDTLSEALEQWKRLPNYRPDLRVCKVGLSPEHALKNRYRNFPAYDATRVMFLDPSRYINANYVYVKLDGVNSKLVIATQKPLKNTWYDFWDMIWQHSSKYILNLDNSPLFGDDSYWDKWTIEPEAKNIIMNGIAYSILTPKESSLGLGISMVSFDLIKTYPIGSNGTRKKSESRGMSMIRVTSWEKHRTLDFDVVSILLHVIHSTWFSAENHPLVVHCSAGLGRTGSVCALLKAVYWPLEGKIDTEYIYRSCEYVRNVRPGSIRNFEQYSFIYNFLTHYRD